MLGGKMKVIQKVSPLSHEKGATLVVALVILVVMSMVGLASMSSSTLQARMAFNQKQKMLSMLAADAVLRTAENYILENIRHKSHMSRFNGNDGLFADAQLGITIPLSVSSAEEEFSNGDMTLTANWLDGNSAEVTTFDSSVSVREGRYTIEYVGKYDPTVNQPTDTTKGDDDRHPYMFRIVAIGWGQDPNISTVLQSTFRTGTDVEYQ